MQAGGIAVAEVAEKVRLHVAFGEELLIAAETRLARRKELLIDLRVIESGHRSAIEPQRPGRHDQVGALQAGIPPRSEEHTSELQSHHDLVCRLLLEKKK